MLFRRIAAAALVCALLIPGVSAAVPHGGERAVLLIEGDADAASLAARIPGARVLYEYSLIDAAALSVPPGLVPQAEKVFSAAPGVTDVSVAATFLAPDGAAQSASSPEVSPNDKTLRAKDGAAGAGTLIAVLDTGFDLAHPSFAALPEGAAEAISEDGFAEAVTDTYAVFSEGRDGVGEVWHSAKVPFAYDYADGDTDVAGTSAHGTHVAAIAGASTAGGGELDGTAPGAQLALMKVFNDAGTSCSEHALILAVEDAVRLGASVINLSLGSLALTSKECSMRQLAKALAKAEAAGAVIVCAMGNDGRGGASGVLSDTPRASDPDYGLPSEPATLPVSLAAGAASNSVLYADYITADGRRIVYDESYEAARNESPTLAETLGGRSLTLAVIPGEGHPEEYAERDVAGRAVLVRRGGISFGDKVKNAAEAGAAAVIVYEPNGTEAFVMQLGGEAAIPAVSVSASDGAYLAARDGVSVAISAEDGVFSAAGDGIASFSSWGPTSDLVLKPDLCAVGSSVLAAVPGGGYAVMDGTSMAAPQISGAAARYIASHRETLEALEASERAAFVRRHLVSAAEVLTTVDGVPLSPRAQGSGVLRTWEDGVLMTAADGGSLWNFGDRCTGVLRFGVRLTNETDAARTVTLTVPLITDETELRDGVFYLTGASKRVPAALSAAAAAGIAVTDAGVVCTVPAGETAEVSLTLTADAEYFSALAAKFTNGFYLEGFVIARGEDGQEAASLPFLAFAGRWADAPMLDGGDWDGYDSFYGGQYILLTRDHESYAAGMTENGALSVLFAFSPNGDGRGDDALWELLPLRNISDAQIVISDADGNTVYENMEIDLMKAHVEDGVLVSALLPLWSGSDGVNDHFVWQDGAYTVRVTFASYAGGEQTFSFPLRIDTEKPRLAECSVTDGVLRARFTDNAYLAEVRVYVPDPEKDGEFILDVTETVAYEADVHEASIEAALPEGLSYVYVSAEDHAGNLTVIRQYLS